MTDRYFVAPPILGSKAVLTGPEAHHLVHVMRAEPDAEVVLFDGSGAEFVGRIEEVGRSEVHLSILSRRVVDRELPLDLTLGVCLPKGDRQKWLIEKAVELGVRRIVPLRTARSVAQPTEQALTRLRRAVVEAAKQCGRNRLTEIDGPRDWTEFIARPAGTPFRLLAHPGSQVPAVGQTARLARQSKAAWVEGVVAAIGPEGGFTEEEVTQAVAAGWQPADLGPRILRVETAAIWLCALVVQAFSSQPRPPEGKMDADVGIGD